MKNKTGLKKLKEWIQAHSPNRYTIVEKLDEILAEEKAELSLAELKMIEETDNGHFTIRCSKCMTSCMGTFDTREDAGDFIRGIK